MIPEPEDRLAAQRAEMDQLIANLPEHARGLFGYYTAMLEAGFTVDQAFTLTVAWAASLVSSSE